MQQNPTITECPELEGTHKDQVQLSALLWMLSNTFVSLSFMTKKKFWQREGCMCFLSPHSYLPSPHPHNRSTFTMSRGSSAPRQDSQSLHGQSFKGDLSAWRERSPCTQDCISMNWPAHPSVVCATLDNFIPHSGLVDASSHRSGHVFIPCYVYGSSPVNLLGCWVGPNMIRCFCPLSGVEQLEFQVQYHLMLEVYNISHNIARTRCILISSAEESKNNSTQNPPWLSVKKPKSRLFYVQDDPKLHLDGGQIWP